MAYRANVLPIMIASPGDVAEERELARRTIADWNSAHSFSTSLVLVPVGWEQMPASLDGRPQQLINDRLLNACDLLVGIFWTRLGTPSGKFDSGTVEEIQTHLAAGKPAMVYFSDAPARPSSVDRDQLQGVQDFKCWCQSKGIIRTFASPGEFAQQFSNDLQTQINTHPKLTAIKTSSLTDEIFTPSVLASATPAIPDDIGKDAKQLLHEAASDRNGYILVSEGLTRAGFSTNGKFFGDQGPRDFARWKAALEELSDADLIRHGSEPTTFMVTNKGYKKAT